MEIKETSLAGIIGKALDDAANFAIDKLEAADLDVDHRKWASQYKHKREWLWGIVVAEFICGGTRCLLMYGIEGKTWVVVNARTYKALILNESLSVLIEKAVIMLSRRQTLKEQLIKTRQEKLREMKPLIIEHFSGQKFLEFHFDDHDGTFCMSTTNNRWYRMSPNFSPDNFLAKISRWCDKYDLGEELRVFLAEPKKQRKEKKSTIKQ